MQRENDMREWFNIYSLRLPSLAARRVTVGCFMGECDPATSIRLGRMVWYLHWPDSGEWCSIYSLRLPSLAARRVTVGCFMGECDPATSIRLGRMVWYLHWPDSGEWCSIYSLRLPSLAARRVTVGCFMGECDPATSIWLGSMTSSQHGTLCSLIASHNGDPDRHAYCSNILSSIWKHEPQYTVPYLNGNTCTAYNKAS